MNRRFCSANTPSCGLGIELSIPVLETKLIEGRSYFGLIGIFKSSFVTVRLIRLFFFLKSLTWLFDESMAEADGILLLEEVMAWAEGLRCAKKFENCSVKAGETDNFLLDDETLDCRDSFFDGFILLKAAILLFESTLTTS